MVRRPLRSIRARYFLLVIGAALGLAAAGVILVVRLRSEAVRSAGEYAMGNLRTVALNVDEIARNVAFVLTPLLTSQSFADLSQDLSYLNPVSSYASLLRMRQLEETLRRSYLSNNYITSISCFDLANGIAIAGRADLQKVRDVDVRTTAWYRNYERIPDREWWTASRGFGGTETILSSYRLLRVNDGGWQTRGIVSIDVRAAVVQDIVGKISLGQDGRAFVLDCLGNLVATVGVMDAESASRIVAAFTRDARGRDYQTVAVDKGLSLVALHQSPQSGLQFVAVMPLQHVDTFLPIVLTHLIWTYAGLVIVIVAMALITYVSYYRPLSKLFLGMKQLAAGDFTVSLESGRKDEVGDIYENFNRSVRDLKRLVDDNYLMQISRKDARLKIVLSQLNEHFLYNTLDCIHWLARKHGVSEIADVVQSLSRFYSLSLSNGRDMVRVSDILGIIESYLSIQRVRRPDGFHYRCDADPSILDRVVLKYLFQPLVENAVVHGLSDTVVGGSVEVSFHRAGEMIRFEVQDNGKGIPPDKLDAIRTDLAREAEDAGGAFALCNVSTQLRLCYGPTAGLFMESAPGAGTRAWIDIPLARNGEPDA